MKAVFLVLALLAGQPAHAGGVDDIYPPDVLAEWQFRIGRFARGVMQDEILPVLTPAERDRLARVVIDVPPSAPGQEPFAFWRDGDTVHFSAASMKLLGDLLLAYAWLGRNFYAPATLDDYMGMLAYWHADAPPPPPRIALGVPDTARDDAGTDRLATLLTHDAFLFVILHELGHVLHGDTVSVEAEMAADRFALDVLGRIGRVPSGIATFLQLANAYAPHGADPHSGYGAAARQTHPVSLSRLREVAADIGLQAQRYARDQEPATLAAFRLLAEQLQTLADLESDPRSQAFLALRGSTVLPADLAPRRPGEIIAAQLGQAAGAGPFAGKLAGTITLGGTPFDAEAVLEWRAGRVIGDYGVAGVFGHFEGVPAGDVLPFAWSSGSARGRGRLRREGDTYTGTAGTGATTDGTVWDLRRIAR